MRRTLVLIPMLAAMSLGACQDYNFNPVGHCIIQPGSTRHSLANVATADILFVVDDSGSMGPKQQALATNFKVFIDDLNQTNTDRVNCGLEPLDFHIAITTSSIFSNYDSSGTMCVTNSGTQQCCPVDMSSCVDDPTCSPGQACGSGSGRCVDNYASAIGTAFQTKRQCCTPQLSLCTGTAGCYPGWACGTFVTTYPSASVLTSGACTPGVASADAPYPAGDFVAAPGNPKVLHFTKSLYTPTINQTAINTLITQFQQNIQVGTCGSGQEQHLESARMAIQKALAGKQAGVVPNTADGWPHQGAKLVVVWVGDEDDCSSPDDPVKALVDVGANNAGQDYCAYQSSLPQDQQILTKVSDFADYLKGLQRPLGAAFVVSAVQCADGTYAAADLHNAPPAGCNPPVPACSLTQGAGYRFIDLATMLNSVVLSDSLLTGSVCEDFGGTLGKIADLVKPPNSLKLDTQPAAGDLAVLQIMDANGNTRKTCNGPAPAGADITQAVCRNQSGGPVQCDWWFIASCDPGASTTPVTSSQCVYINHNTCSCEPNPGEVYSAEYMGRVPESGCSAAASQSAECAGMLGGKPTDWSCFIPAGQTVGTCLCTEG